MIVFSSCWGKARSDVWISSAWEEHCRAAECQQDRVPALCLLALSCSHPLWFTIAWIYCGVPCIIPFWLFVYQLGTFFLYHMWFDTMWKWCAALHDGGPNLLAFDAHSDDLMCGTSCLWFLVLVLGLGCNPHFLTWFAWPDLLGADFWQLCVGMVTAAHRRTLALWEVAHTHICVQNRSV